MTEKLAAGYADIEGSPLTPKELAWKIGVYVSGGFVRQFPPSLRDALGLLSTLRWVNVLNEHSQELFPHEETVWAFIAGAFEANGRVSKGKVKLNATKAAAAEFLLEKLQAGGIAHAVIGKATHPHQEVDGVFVRDPSDLALFAYRIFARNKDKEEALASLRARFSLVAEGLPSELAPSDHNGSSGNSSVVGDLVVDYGISDHSTDDQLPSEAHEPDAAMLGKAEQEIVEDTYGSEDLPDEGEEDAFKIYMCEIAAHRLLTAEEEIQFAKEYEEGINAESELSQVYLVEEERLRLEEIVTTGQAARRRMIESNLRLVVYVARKYKWRGLLLLDLIQEGSIGLNRAVEKYDWRKGFRFTTYAYWWIRQAITRAISDQSRTIRLPMHITELVSKLVKAARELEEELGREPTTVELAEKTVYQRARIEEVRRAAMIPISLDTSVGEEEVTVGDFVAADQPSVEDKAIESALKDDLWKAMQEAGLTPREREVLVLRFGIRDGKERSLEEIGTEFGVSRERIRQIEGDALRKLRQPRIKAKLQDYLG